MSTYVNLRRAEGGGQQLPIRGELNPRPVRQPPADDLGVVDRPPPQAVDQVGLAVSQMDQSTQRNTALIEESAAASETLRQQARQLVEAVAAFKTMRSDVPHANAALAFNS